MANTYNTLSGLFTATADAIRAKTGGTSPIKADDFPTEIANIPTGGGSVIPSDLPQDGKTRVCYKIPENASVAGKKITLMFNNKTSETVTSVDWGDGTAAAESTGAGRKTLQHEYSTAGNKIVAITVSAGGIDFGGGSSYQIYGNDPITKPYIYWVVIGNNVGKIDGYAFNQCTALKEIRLPATGITDIGTYAFAECVSLEDITLPAGLTTLGTYALYQCRGLKSATIQAGSFTEIPRNICEDCSTLQSITLPNNLTSFAQNCFNRCFTLAQIIIPSGVTSLGNTVFQMNYLITELTIPATVSALGSSALYYMQGLQKLRFEGTIPPVAAASNTFSGISTACIISVPTGYLSAYTSAQYYPSSSTYTYIEED